MKKLIKKQIVRFVKPRLSAVFYRKLKHVSYASWFTFMIASGKIKRFIIKPKLPVLANGHIYLHLGCGNIDAPGFINIDIVPKKHVHHVRSIENLSIFKDDSVDFIYASHCLEHLSHRLVPLVLAEWYRVLKKGGVLCLSVPDFNLLLDIYIADNRNIDSIQGYLMGGQDYSYNFHKIIFNHDNLTDLLYKVGFTEVREWTPDSDNLHSVPGYASGMAEIRGKQYPISLNLEAIKGEKFTL